MLLVNELNLTTVYRGLSPRSLREGWNQALGSLVTVTGDSLTN